MYNFLLTNFLEGSRVVDPKMGWELYRQGESRPRLYAVCRLEFYPDGGNIAAP